MSEVRHKKIKVELIWWILTAVVVMLALIPIMLKVPAYPFYYQNILLIVVFITFSRYALFLRLTFLARMKWIKVAIILSSALFLFIVSTAMQDFRNYMDEKGLQTLVDDLNVYQQTRIIRYIKHEMIFFGTGSFIAGILLPLRMVVSLWRMHNSGRV